MFKTIKNNFHKSEAAVVAQLLLEKHQFSQELGKEPARLANILVQEVWEVTTHLFDGRFGQRPHKMTIAAAAFAQAIHGQHLAIPVKLRYAMCLAELLQEFDRNGHRYPLNGLDQEIVQQCLLIFSEFNDDMEEHPLRKETNRILGQGNEA